MRGGSFEAFPFFIVMEKEIWKDIKGYEGLYEVSNMARIRTVPHLMTAKDGRKMIIPAKIRKQSIDWHGYLYVKVRRGNKQTSLRVHRAIMEAFVPNPYDKPFIDHINTIKTDNRIENIKWVTAHENTQNLITLERIKDACTEDEIKRQIQVKKDNGTWNGRKVFQYSKDGAFIAEYETLSDAAKVLNKDARRCSGNISIAVDNPRRSAYGYKWYSKRIEPTQ